MKVLNAKWDNESHSSFTAIIQHDVYGNIPYTVCLTVDDESDTHKELVALYNNGKIHVEDADITHINKDKEQCIRLTRNMYLRDTDCYMLCDYPISESDKEEIRVYRQQLRDITKQKEFPNNVIWPKIPDCITDNH